MRLRFEGTIWYWRGPALWPKDGAYVVPIKKALQDAERLDVDDVVTVDLEIDA